MRSATLGTFIVLIATLLVTGVASAQDSRASVVLTTKHFAFYSDLATNFDGLPAADRSQWTRAVDYYAAGKFMDFQGVLMRLELAGLLPRDGPGDAATWQLLDEVAAIRMVATPAYRQCRWTAQDAQNRAWVARLEPLLSQYEATLGGQLPRLYQVPWVGLPFRVDVVETGPSLGANAVSPGGDATLQALVSSNNPDNQGSRGSRSRVSRREPRVDEDELAAERSARNRDQRVRRHVAADSSPARGALFHHG
jgi:hypothetical protein